MTDLKGKNGIILGVANHRSIAWSVAQHAHAAGANLILNYQGERIEKKVRDLAGKLDGTLCLPCDLGDDEQMDRFFEQAGEHFGGKLDFLVHSVAFANRQDLAGRYSDTSREGFRLALDISAYTLVAAAKRARPMFEAAGGGSIVTMTYLGAERVVENYNVMGVAKAALEASVRYLAYDLGPGNVRVNAVSAGPIKTLAANGISGFSHVLGYVAALSPLKRNVEADEVGSSAAFLLSDAAAGISGEVIHVDCGFSTVGISSSVRAAVEND